MSEVIKLQFNNRTLRFPGNSGFLGYVEPEPPSPPAQTYTRFMWKFTAASSLFQMSAIKINDVSTFTRVNSNPSSGFSGEGPDNFLNGNTANKWCVSVSSGTEYYIIFDAASPIAPTSYALATANDTASNPGRNPSKYSLWATTGTPTSSTDSSWVKLTESTAALPAANYTWTTVWSA